MSAVNDGHPLNPNAYDDDAYTEVSNEFQGNVVEMLDNLWKAGASVANIEMEIATAIENTDIPPGGMPDVRVSITIVE